MMSILFVTFIAKAGKSLSEKLGKKRCTVSPIFCDRTHTVVYGFNSKKVAAFLKEVASF